MSTTDAPSMAEDSEMLESDGEKVVTMMDVLQEQQDFEDDANAVLGASDEKNCTYPKGYIKRQAVFACLTCTEAKTDPTKRAGVCLACSLSCHENHEVIELYTKRNFCCDCGNPKFNSNPCQFLPQKPDMNVNNSYNQNFSGLYCTCHRPYPDPDSTFEDEMIQCIVCEDWLHASHLEAVVPPNEQYSEMICKTCMQKNEFLYDYSDLAVNVDIETDVVSINGTEPTMCNGNVDKKEIAQNRKENDLDVDMTETHESAELSVEDKKETSDKPAESGVDGGKEISDTPADLAEDKKENDEMLNTETGTDNKESSDIKPNDSSESKIDCEIPQNNTDRMEVEQTEQNRESDEVKLKESKLDGNDSTVVSETDVTDTHNVPENKDLKDDNLTESSADDKSETVTEQKNIEETKISEQSTGIINEKNSENKVDTEIKDSENSEQNVAEENTKSTDAAKETQHDEPKDDVLESIDKIINEDNDDSAADKAKAEEESTKKTESDSKENIDDNKLEIKESDTDDMAANKKTDSEANEEEMKQNDEEKSENKRKFDEDLNDTAVKKAKFEDNKNCKRPRDPKKKLKGAAFWPSNFRQMLCTCNECLTMYKDLSVLFLIDPEDTVTAYEMLGKEMTEALGASQYEKGLKALSSLDRIQQINALTEYNKMRDKLLEFLKSFKDRQEIVKEEDIKAFFAGMKPKREPDGVYFCR